MNNRNERLQHLRRFEHKLDDDCDFDYDDDKDEVEESTSTTVNLPELAKKILQHVHSGINKIRINNPESCDVELTVGQHTISAHIVVLSSCSLYFNTMFSTSFLEKDTKKVVLEDFDDDIVKILIDYMYTAELPIDSKNCLRIYLMARKLQITIAEEVSIEYIIEEYDLYNCFEILKWAVKNDVEKVRGVGIKYIATNFSYLCMCPEFTLFDYNDLKKLLAEKSVWQFPADILFTFIARWGYADRTRYQYLDGLLNTINISHVTNDLLLSPKLAKYLPSDILTKFIAKSETINLNGVNNLNVILCSRLNTANLKLYRHDSEIKFEMEKLPKPYFDGCYFSYGSSVYHSGGCLTNQPASHETFCYNIYTNKWLPFMPLLRPKACHASVVMNGKIYTCGGSDGYRTVSSVESLDLISGRQMVLPDMKFPRESLAVSSFNNAIYVMGGHDRVRHQNAIIERFDPRIGVWESLKRPSCATDINYVAKVGNFIYSTNGVGNTMERFDFVENKFMEIYTENNIYPLCIFSYQNELYGVFDKHISQYESESRTWKMKQRLLEQFKNSVALPIVIAPLLCPLVTNKK